MVHFGQRIAKERYDPWVDHYFDYDLLKRRLKAIQNAPGQSQSDEAIQEFQHALDREIEKVGPYSSDNEAYSDWDTGLKLPSLPGNQQKVSTQACNKLHHVPLTASVHCFCRC